MLVKFTPPIVHVKLNSPKKKRVNNKQFKGIIYNDFFIHTKGQYYLPINYLPMIGNLNTVEEFIEFDRFIIEWFEKYLFISKGFNSIEEMVFNGVNKYNQNIASVIKLLFGYSNEYDKEVGDLFKVTSVFNTDLKPFRKRIVYPSEYALAKKNVALVLGTKKAINVLDVPMPVKYITLWEHSTLAPYLELTLVQNKYIIKTVLIDESLSPFQVSALPDKVLVFTYGGLVWKFKRKNCWDKMFTVNDIDWGALLKNHRNIRINSRLGENTIGFVEFSYDPVNDDLYLLTFHFKKRPPMSKFNSLSYCDSIDLNYYTPIIVRVPFNEIKLDKRGSLHIKSVGHDVKFCYSPGFYQCKGLGVNTMFEKIISLRKELGYK